MPAALLRGCRLLYDCPTRKEIMAIAQGEFTSQVSVFHFEATHVASRLKLSFINEPN
jgi:hypothetical protein